MAPRRKNPVIENPPEYDDSPVIDRDPLKELLGVGTHTTVIGNEDEEIPEDIAQAFEEHGLNAKYYRCVLKEKPDGEEVDSPGMGKGQYIKSWVKSIPSVEWIARNYGPGSYFLVFYWQVKNEETGNRKQKSATIPVEVSQKFRGEYQRYQWEQNIQRVKEQKEQMKAAKMESYLDGHLLSDLQNGTGTGEAGVKDPKEYLAELAQTAKLLGFRQPGGGNELMESLVKLAVPLLPTIIQGLGAKARAENERWEKMMMFMMNQNQNSSSQILDVLKSVNGPMGTGDQMKELREMVFSMLDIKNELQGNKSNVVDKVLQMVESVAPVLGSYMAMSQQQREKQIPYKMAQQYVQSDPTFDAIRQDREKLVELVTRLDTVYGWEQADQILAVGNMTRPDECPRRPDQRYEAGNPQNEATEGQVEVQDDNPEANAR